MKYFFSLVTNDLQELMNKEDYNTPAMKKVIDWDKIRAMQEGSEKDNAINIKGEPVDQEVKRRQRQFGILGEDE